jgi:hypothetical protein
VSIVCQDDRLTAITSLCSINIIWWRNYQIKKNYKEKKTLFFHQKSLFLLLARLSNAQKMFTNKKRNEAWEKCRVHSKGLSSLGGQKSIFLYCILVIFVFLYLLFILRPCANFPNNKLPILWLILLRFPYKVQKKLKIIHKLNNK